MGFADYRIFCTRTSETANLKLLPNWRIVFEGRKTGFDGLGNRGRKSLLPPAAAYRLLSYTPIRRILFLVDRNNLGKQAEGEFGTFRLAETGEPFNTIFAVERLKCKIPTSNRRCCDFHYPAHFASIDGKDFTDEDELEDI